MRPMIKKQTENVTIYKQSIPPKLAFYALNIFTFWDTVNKIYILIKKVFKSDQYFSVPVTERNFAFS